MARIAVPKDKRFQYRYVIVESNRLNPEKLVVKRWEAFRVCRSGSAKGQSGNFGELVFVTKLKLFKVT